MPPGSINNQENQEGWGGARPGAGRPQGSSNKPKISDHITPEEVKALVIKAKTLADGGNEAMLKFLLEQIYGKPRQNVARVGFTPASVMVPLVSPEPSGRNTAMTVLGFDLRKFRQIGSYVFSVGGR